MNTIETTVDLEKCTGCGCCRNVCPVDAIEMNADAEGFLMPSIDTNKCIQCGKCSERCPVLEPQYKNTSKPDVYAFMANDEVRAVSSSGGVFTLLAQKILNRDGVVYGAAFDENMQLRHVVAEKMEQIVPIRGSKYLQSNIGFIYRSVKQQLDSGKSVLFTGTPCQIAALYNFLETDYDNLYTVDLICHGVPSQYEMNLYIDELYANLKISKEIKIKDIRFRDKKFGWSAEHIVVEFEDGQIHESDLSQDNYLKMFHRNLGLRKACSNCPFSIYPRQGDISIGDFWGISKIDCKLNDEKGTSLVLINSDKGAKFFSDLPIQKIMNCEKIDFDAKRIGNRTNAIFPANKNRDRFLRLIKQNGFNKAVERVQKGTFDVGIVSNWCAKNFGGSLTQYALYHVVEDMGYSALMIERPLKAVGEANSTELRKIYEEIPYPSYAMARQYETKEQMRRLNKICDKFLVGSDQLFQYSVYCALGKFTTLDWVDDTKLKIAYAASYGPDHIWGDKDDLVEMAYFMQKFDHFSVREKSGIEISKKNFGVDAKLVLDPVFLCDIRHYDALIEKSDRKLPEKYIAAYILDPNDDKYKIIKMAMDKLNMPEEVYSELGKNLSYIEPLKDLNVVQMKVEERLQSIKNCDFFITDSFHGTCFAILFKKPFISILNTKRGGSRFSSLLEMFHLENRLIKGAEEMERQLELFSDIDYVAVYEILQKERVSCIEWLQSALSGKKQEVKMDYDIIQRYVEQQQRKIITLEKENTLLRRKFNEIFNISLQVSLVQITNLEQYIEQLCILKEKYLICISVKDTPGIVFKQELVPLTKKLGLEISLFNRHWHSYLAVIDNGKVVFEKIGDITEMIRCDMMIDKIHVKLLSAGLKSGNHSEIMINDVNYSNNVRGLNFVVFDKENNCLVDAVSFDTNVSQMTCTR